MSGSSAQIFGKRSKKVVDHVNDNQLTFEWFKNSKPLNKEETKTVASHDRRKPNRNGQDKITFSSDLPVKTTVLDLSEKEKICEETGETLVQIGAKVFHKLAHEPGSYYIKEIVRP